MGERHSDFVEVGARVSAVTTKCSMLVQTVNFNFQNL